MARIAALSLAVGLLMATIYTQDWSGGNDIPPMETSGHTSGTADYPFVTFADDVQVSGGKLQSSTGEWENASWEEQLFGSETDGYWNGKNFNVTVPYSILSAALDDIDPSTAPILILEPKSNTTTFFEVYVFPASAGSDTWTLQVTYANYNASPFKTTLDSYTFSRAAVEGTTLTLRVCGTTASQTFGAGSIPADGAFQVYWGSDLAYSVTDEDFYFNDATSSADVDFMRGFTIGAGFIGQIGTITITDTACASPIQVNDTTPCCSGGSGGGGGNTGLNPDPTGDLPPWTQSCTGGGAVDAVADLDSGEDWS